jgi:hypothetical protein
MKFGVCKVSSPYNAGSLMTVEKEISYYESDSVGVQEVRRDRGGTEPASDEYTFFYGKGNENLGTGSLYIRESYQQFRGYSLLAIGCHT